MGDDGTLSEEGYTNSTQANGETCGEVGTGAENTIGEVPL